MARGKNEIAFESLTANRGATIAHGRYAGKRTGFHRLHLRHHRQTERHRSCASLDRRPGRFEPLPLAAAGRRRRHGHRRMELHQRARPQFAFSAAQRRHRRRSYPAAPRRKIFSPPSRNTASPCCIPSPPFIAACLRCRHSKSSTTFRQLRCAHSTGEALREATYEEWKQRVGSELYEHYGVSEYQLVIGHGVRHPVKPGSVGKLLPGVGVAILDDEFKPVADRRARPVRDLNFEIRDCFSVITKIVNEPKRSIRDGLVSYRRPRLSG